MTGNNALGLIAQVHPEPEGGHSNYTSQVGLPPL